MKNKILINTLFISFSSGTGIAVIFAAILISIQSMYEKSTLVALCIVCSQLASVLLTSVISKISDSRKSIDFLGLSYLITFSFSIICTLAFINKKENIYLYIILVATCVIITLVRLIDQITRTSILHQFLNKNEYLSASKYLELTRQGITFFSGGVSVFLITKSNIYQAFIFCSLCQLISIILLYYMKSNVISQNKSQDEKKDLPKLSFKSYLKEYEYAEFMFLTSIPYSIVLALNSIYPKSFLRISDNPQFYAALVIPYGLGAIIGSLISNKMVSIGWKKSILSLQGFFCLCLFVYPYINSIEYIYIVIFLLSFTHSSIRIVRNNKLMIDTKKGFIGKISGYYELFSLMLSIFIGFLSSFLIDYYDYFFGFLIIPFIMMVSFVFTIFLSRKRRFIFSWL